LGQIGSVFPEKLVFENNEYRTTKLNNVVVLICPTYKELSKKKGGKKSDFSESSLLAEREGFEPPGLLHPVVFKTTAIDHSATSPKQSAKIELSCKLVQSPYILLYFCFNDKHLSY
jgi:hypothetical protein